MIRETHNAKSSLTVKSKLDKHGVVRKFFYIYSDFSIIDILNFRFSIFFLLKGPLLALKSSFNSFHKLYHHDVVRFLNNLCNSKYKPAIKAFHGKHCRLQLLNIAIETMEEYFSQNTNYKEFYAREKWLSQTQNS